MKLAPIRRLWVFAAHKQVLAFCVIIVEKAWFRTPLLPNLLKTLIGVADSPHLLHHAFSIMHAPSYATENASALRQDWPRIPLPKSRKQLVAFADLARQIAALLDPETPVPGVTAGKVRPELKLLGVAVKVGGGQFRRERLRHRRRWKSSAKEASPCPAPATLDPSRITQTAAAHTFSSHSGRPSPFRWPGQRK
ncbi:MAG: type ISP restriction/modification enzyme [Pirellulaceae bacterium]